MTLWSIEVRDPEDAGARAAVRAYSAELDALLGASSPTIVDPDPEAYRGPRGTFLVVVDAGEVLGCAGLRVIDVPPYGRVAEVKRMWVSARLRGRGVGRALLERLHADARARGLERVVLDSKRELLDARRLYLAAGYEDIEPYGDNADATAWMGLRLDGGDWASAHEA
ncbi:MAG TPA: GNAT family N-acetyltransferase [Candidatus Nanopelagicales bacterium]|nr:GNAT family N-acetyltransferase [Candidatus Nanopelagicales bacterium]